VRVRYDPARVTVEQLLQVIEKQSYKAKVIADPSP
jgi:hypothetical protein